MAPTVELSATTFSRLQALAIPFVDTPDTVINRLIDSFEKQATPPKTSAAASGDASVQIYNASAAPDLTHTKVLAMELDGQPLERGQANWNGLLVALISRAKSVAQNSAELKRLITVNFFEGEKSDEGYRHLPKIGLSVQGQDANGAWRAINHLARELGCSVAVTFAWRTKEGAAFPGMTGRFVIPGK